MRLEEKEITCQCGHTLMIDRSSDWCTKCAKRVFYDPKDERFNKINTYYMYTVVFGVIFFLTYVFVELIATPVLG